MKRKKQLEANYTNTRLLFNLFGAVFAISFSFVLAYLLDTGSLVDWVAKHKETKLDEIVFSGIALLVAVCIFSAHKWARFSRLVIRYEESSKAADLYELERVRTAQRRDGFYVGLAMLSSVVFVHFFDTGALAQWLAEHKDSKVDEVIVTGVVLLAGLLYFSVRRWLELTDQVLRYEDLHRKTTKLNGEIILLGELSESLQCCLSAEEAYPLITASAQALFPESSGSVCIIASSRDMVETVAVWGSNNWPERQFEPKDCWALRRGRLHRFDNEPTSPACAHLGTEQSVESLCVPMMAHGEALGLVCLNTGRTNDSEARAESLSSDERLARTLAEQAALSLANLSMRDILRMQSVRDPLTGLYNRRYMEESLEREVRRSVRNASSLGILMIDVDHFKNLNDTFGHDAGDAVLRSLGSLLKAHFRAEDILCRYGGEEFTVILPEASAQIAFQRASSLCESAKQMLVQHRGQPLRSISLSIGLAIYGEHGTAADLLIRAADSALYCAKQEGRDRVVIASPSDVNRQVSQLQ
jgi:diguanylate cyclase (GGDEF)-like protein